MAYYSFRITEFPKRMSLLVDTPAKKCILKKEYLLALETSLFLKSKSTLYGVPFDLFKYQIKATKTSAWSQDIDMIINVDAVAGTPACPSPVIDFSMQFQAIRDIRTQIPIPTTADRIKITQLEGGNELMINGQPVEIDKTYMIYEFTTVLLSTTIPQDETKTYHSRISYSLGNKTAFVTPSCVLTVDKSYLAYIKESYENKTEDILVLVDGEVKKSSFRRVIEIFNGLTPNATAKIYVQTDYNVTNLKVTANEVETELSNGVGYVEVDLNDHGYAYIEITGTPLLETSEEQFAFNLEVELIDIDGHANKKYIDSGRDLLLLSVYSNPDYIKDFFLIKEVKLSSIYFTETISDDITVNTSAADIELEADISIYYNKGTVPFLYEIIQNPDDTDTTITITNTDYTNKFTIGGLDAAAGSGNAFNFTAKITDGNNVISKKDFKVTVVTAAAGAAPSVTSISPATPLSYESNDPISVNIIASNTPTSYRAVDLPTGLTLNTNTGVITGSIAYDDGGSNSHPFDVYASNAYGESSVYPVALTITAASGVAPIINNTSPEVITLGDTEYILIDIDSSSSTPLTVNVTNMSSGVSFDSSWAPNGQVTVEMLDDVGQFTIEVTNAYGTDSKLIALMTPL